ncbi:2-amino-4-hydroxy-6-hydroxymethyldihydropteridine diphosphokinase [Cryptosporangium arvum]|uniref:2-amino-4-hydroxy-6-hydroxymethyldihydropteridine diphosphokinase n=1 Tax=Cryptosporangium arvum DSM 44712 TaxID=927661 RepID=A0A011ABH9_9ACTN|nr:2-amino-4-hydroxy-6-hydroxymethyldihydropteridine diphosphokinase [Cryptosporangium arvum]EXG79371.1 2-amino-4-hydroxy-6-hydroxymethyldihydropteridine pyrophosphokinase [Cryptosporangium arvum DSM 44712]
MTRAVLSIGSNLGDRLANLAGVITALPGARVSPVYETDPWGPVPQDDYLNAIVVAEDAGRDAAGWLSFVREAERAAGRVRDVRWGPRTLDVDVVQVHDVRGEAVLSEDPSLTLPHPLASQRAFVLVPWLAVEPDAVLAGHGAVRELVDALPDDDRGTVRRRDDLSLER